jgi:thioredoxin 1
LEEYGLSEGFDEELERIKLKKLKEIMGSSRSSEGSSIEASPLTLTDENFDEVISKHKLVFVDFWAPWCAPCRMIAPMVEELSREFAGKIVFGKLNTDENPQTAMKYMISAIPTLILFKNGAEAERIIGVTPKQAIEAVLRKHLE